MLQPFGNAEEKRRYAQHGVDVIHLEHNAFETIDLYHFMYHKLNLPMDLIGQLDHETNQRIRDLNIKEQVAFNLTYDRLFKDTEFIATMRKLLQTLEVAYGHPVDMEFTVNTDSQDALTYNLVQCRPLQTKGTNNQVDLPSPSKESIYFQTQGHFMGGSIDIKVDHLLLVEPKAYSDLSQSEKFTLAKLIGKLNRRLHSLDSVIMLIAPGRIGSSTPSLGVPLSFSDICHMTILCETAYPLMGMTPDLSFGSHFFQDLVENEMFYVALFPEEETTYYTANYFAENVNLLTEILPEAKNFEPVLKVIALNQLKLVAQIESQTLICYQSDEG
jgi:hypothetical protein